MLSMHCCRLLMLACGLTLLAGCLASDARDREWSARGAPFLLAEEPAGATGILEFREEPPAAAGEVVLLGRIGGAKQVWSDQSAEFLICDPTHQPDEAHDACHGDNCPFCKNKAEPNSALAVVMLTGADGRVPPVAARKLLPLAEGQMVVVRGQAEINAIGQLVVRASGVYIRQ